VSLTAKKALVLGTVLLAVAALSVCVGRARAGSSSAHESSAAHTLVIPCDEKASTDPSGTEDGYRVVLGIVSVPPPVLRQVVRTTSRRWPFSQKAGLDIHPTHKTVTVVVPKAWRKRVAIDWGNARPPVSTLKFQPCPYGNLGWNGYAGGFSLSKRRECVPLLFKVASRSRIVRFGFDRRCPSS
jgi:hypothetical protein